MTNEELQAALATEREARIRAEATLQGYRMAVAEMRSGGTPVDSVAERRREYDRNRKRKGSVIPVDSGGIPADVTPPTPPLDGPPPSSASISPLPFIPSPPPVLALRPATETLALALGNVPAPEEAAKKPAKPKKPPTAVTEFGEWCVAERAKAVPATAVDDTKLRPDQWARLGEAHRDYGRKLLEAAFLAFLAAPYPRSRDCPLGLFVGQLEKWLTEGKSASPAANDSKPTKFLVL